MKLYVEQCEVGTSQDLTLTPRQSVEDLDRVKRSLTRLNLAHAGFNDGTESDSSPEEIARTQWTPSRVSTTSASPMKNAAPANKLRTPPSLNQDVGSGLELQRGVNLQQPVRLSVNNSRTSAGMLGDSLLARQAQASHVLAQQPPIPQAPLPPTAQTDMDPRLRTLLNLMNKPKITNFHPMIIDPPNMFTGGPLPPKHHPVAAQEATSPNPPSRSQGQSSPELDTQATSAKFMTQIQSAQPAPQVSKETVAFEVQGQVSLSTPTRSGPNSNTSSQSSEILSQGPALPAEQPATENTDASPVNDVETKDATENLQETVPQQESEVADLISPTKKSSDDEGSSDDTEKSLPPEQRKVFVPLTTRTELSITNHRTPHAKYKKYARIGMTRDKTEFLGREIAWRDGDSALPELASVFITPFHRSAGYSEPVADPVTQYSDQDEHRAHESEDEMERSEDEDDLPTRPSSSAGLTDGLESPERDSSALPWSSSPPQLPFIPPREKTLPPDSSAEKQLPREKANADDHMKYLNDEGEDDHIEATGAFVELIKECNEEALVPEDDPALTIPVNGNTSARKDVQEISQPQDELSAAENSMTSTQKRVHDVVELYDDSSDDTSDGEDGGIPATPNALSLGKRKNSMSPPSAHSAAKRRKLSASPKTSSSEQRTTLPEKPEVVPQTSPYSSSRSGFGMFRTSTSSQPVSLDPTANPVSTPRAGTNILQSPTSVTTSISLPRSTAPVSHPRVEVAGTPSNSSAFYAMPAESPHTNNAESSRSHVGDSVKGKRALSPQPRDQESRKKKDSKASRWGWSQSDSPVEDPHARAARLREERFRSALGQAAQQRRGTRESPNLDSVHASGVGRSAESSAQQNTGDTEHPATAHSSTQHAGISAATAAHTDASKVESSDSTASGPSTEASNMEQIAPIVTGAQALSPTSLHKQRVSTHSPNQAMVVSLENRHVTDEASLDQSAPHDKFLALWKAFTEAYECGGNLKLFQNLTRRFIQPETAESRVPFESWDPYTATYCRVYPQYLQKCAEDADVPVPFSQMWSQCVFGEGGPSKQILSPQSIREALEGFATPTVSVHGSFEVQPIISAASTPKAGSTIPRVIEKSTDPSGSFSTQLSLSTSLPDSPKVSNADPEVVHRNESTTRSPPAVIHPVTAKSVIPPVTQSPALSALIGPRPASPLMSSSAKAQKPSLTVSERLSPINMLSARSLAKSSQPSESTPASSSGPMPTSRKAMNTTISTERVQLAGPPTKDTSHSAPAFTLASLTAPAPAVSPAPAIVSVSVPTPASVPTPPPAPAPSSTPTSVPANGKHVTSTPTPSAPHQQHSLAQRVRSSPPIVPHPTIAAPQAQSGRESSNAPVHWQRRAMLENLHASESSSTQGINEIITAERLEILKAAGEPDKAIRW